MYGDYANPDDWGSGTSPGGGGTGGGLVRIAAGQLELDGQDPRAGRSEQHGSGGSRRRDLHRGRVPCPEPGAIDASGAVGNFGGGGGGGRIRGLRAADFGNFDTSRITAARGAAYYNFPGGPGTVYLRDPNQPQGTLIFDGGSQGSGWGVLGLPGQDTVTIPDALVLRGTLGHNANVQPDHPGMTLNLSDVTIEGSGNLQSDSVLNLEGSLSVQGGQLSASSVNLLDDQSTLTLDGGQTYRRLRSARQP